MSSERTNKKVKIITNAGYKYYGIVISEDSSFIKLQDNALGEIEIPLANISFVKEFKT